MASVAIGLGLILLLFGLVAAGTIQQSTDAAYRERVILAQALASHVDDQIHQALVTLEREAGDFTLAPGRPLTEDQRHRLIDLRSQESNFAILSIVDVEGNTAWADPSGSEVSVGDPYHDRAIRLVVDTNQPQIVETTSPTDVREIFACLAVPLHDSSGRVAGVLMAEFDPSHPALELLPASQAGSEAGNELEAQLVNATGRILASNEPSSPGYVFEHQALLADLMASQTPGARIHELPPDAGAPSHLVAYAPVSLLPTWGIVIEQPRDVVLAAPRELQQRLIVFGFIALLIAAVLAWSEIRGLVRPLQHLTATAEKFAAGRLDEPVRLDRRDELGILASAFETMRQRLRASMAEIAEWNRELERRVAARTTEAETRNRQLADLIEISELVSGSLDIRPMLDRTLARILQITGAQVGCFRTIESGGSRLELATEHGLSDALRTAQVCAGACLCGRAIALNKVILTGDEGLGPEAIACRAANLQSGVAVPLPAGERIQGVLYLGSRQQGYFHEDGLGTLAAIGRQVGMALANARLYQSLRVREHERVELLQQLMAGQEEERRRVAQELHDDTSQALASLQLGLERLVAGCEKPEQVNQLARQLQGVASQALAEVHRLAVELRPTVLDDIGLVAAIERYLREWERQCGLTVDFASVGVDGSRLVPDAETAVYRIVQAALTNVVQHAHAQRASVLLQRRDDKLVVVIEDDGCGFDLGSAYLAPLERRLGLAGMEERARLMGATLTIEAAPGRGTTVFLEVPLQKNCRRQEGEVRVADNIS